MPALTRGGFTLTELLVALTLLGLVSAGALGVLRQTREAYRAESQEIDLQQNLRIAASFLPAELRELDAADGDLVSMADTAITIRAPRQLAVACRTPQLGPSGELTLTLRDAPFHGLRDFNPAVDSLWIYSEGNVDGSKAVDWMLGSIGSLAPDSCSDGWPARRMTAVLHPSGGRVTSGMVVPAGAAVLGFETVTYRRYRSTEDRRWYVGMQTATDLQPVLGPVTDDGLAFAYFDSSGAATAEPSRVRLVEVRVRARTAHPIRRAGGRLEHHVDSVVLLVALRNNRRY